MGFWWYFLTANIFFHFKNTLKSFRFNVPTQVVRCLSDYHLLRWYRNLHNIIMNSWANWLAHWSLIFSRISSSLLPPSFFYTRTYLPGNLSWDLYDSHKGSALHFPNKSQVFFNIGNAVFDGMTPLLGP